MAFQKGKKKTGGIQKGQKHKKTILKETLGIEKINKIDEFSPRLIDNWIEFINAEDTTIRLLATKELSKYVFATKKQIDTSFNVRRLEDIINEHQDLLSGNKMIEG
ncbi:MAG: hypothetical protein LC122_09580 [Chitinophagales bacterium]|nr:hypothetical protein [Chitinophagales bacterium]